MPCETIGRTFTGYASAYSTSQTQPRIVRRYQKRCLNVDFNGAIPKDELIQSVRWDCTSPWATLISSPGISADQKSVWVNVEFNFGGWGAIKATVTLEDGCVENYEFQFTVKDAPLYPGATYNLANGPYTLEYTVP